MAAQQRSEFFKATDRQLGENDCPEFTYEGFVKDGGDLAPIVAIHKQALRGIKKEELWELCNNTLLYAKENRKIDVIKNLFKMLVHKRWTRGGQGEKDLFYESQAYLMDFFPQIVLDLVSLYPTYGYWKDMLEVTKKITNKEQRERMKIRVVSEYVEGLKEAKKALDEYNNLSEEDKKTNPLKMGLVGKWAPRQNHEADKKLEIVRLIAKELFPDVEDFKVRAKKYRKEYTSPMNEVLHVVENFMAAKKWEEIIFARVTSCAIKRYKHAYANTDKKGNKRSTEQNRIQCAENFLRAMAKGKLKGGQVDAADLIGEIMNGHDDTIALQVCNAQWDSYVNEVVKMIEKRKAQIQEKEINIDAAHAGNWVAMCDVSGSMFCDKNRPINISIAMGLILSDKRICNPAFAGQFMTFSSHPQWVRVGEAQTLSEKITIAQRADWGQSTNFEGANDLIIATVRDGNLKREDIPNGLVVITDMQFNYATHRNGWDTMHEVITKKWNQLGVDMGYSEKLDPPTIIYWNARANAGGYAVESSQRGVVYMSGGSAAQFKNILSGELVQIDQETGEKIQPTPESAVQSILDEDQLIPVDEVLLKNEQSIKDYLGIRHVDPASASAALAAVVSTAVTP